ncbi:hypothetical protein AB0K52_25540 [Glycomyces sp. NPDC049804]|uniref:hypothetical protein n=1 Tax=Glycomyces sp. NPDC049804 TaxID=3154363 RepID=UPI0034285471
MDNPEHLFTDADECVMLRLRDDVITVEVSVTGFRRPPAEIARCVVEAAERLPRPGEDVAASLDADLAAIGGLQAALASGGYDAFAALARRHLGITEPSGHPTAAPEHDRALVEHLGGVVFTMSETKASLAESDTEPVAAEAATPEGDIVVVASTDRTIAEVRMSPTARQRGVEGLGQALTETIAAARAAVRARSDEQARATFPQELKETVESGAAATESFAQDGSAFIERTRQIGDDLKRRISERS